MPKQDKRIVKYKTKKGIRYKFQTYLGTDETGKPINISRSGFENYNDAKYTLDTLRSEGVENYVKNNQKRLDDIYQLWFASYVNQVKSSSAEKTNQYYKNHIYDSLGSVFLNNLSPAFLQKYANDLANNFVNYKSVLSILNRVLKLALVMGYLKSNPLDKIIIPKRTSKKRRDTAHNFYNKDELKAFLDTAEKTNHLYYVYFYLLATTGLRKSEALALHWQDIDLDKNTISVNRTLATGLGGKYITQPPKTKKSKRTIPMNKKCKDLLLSIKQPGTDKVFSTYQDNYLRLSKPTQWLNSIYARNKNLRKITVHGFRHTFASLLIESNPYIKPTDVQAILGHETVQMTLDIYTHATDSGKERIRYTINDFLT